MACKIEKINNKELESLVAQYGATEGLKKFLEGNYIKPGVSELFESNSELNKIGTQQEYSKYLEQGGSQTDIKGFEDFVQGKQFQKLTQEEKAKTIEQVTKEHRSIVALKDLSAKLAHRIGGKVEFVNKTDVDWKGYNQGMTSVLNEAYMTPDTPFHEVLAHPIIRAIKNRNIIYQSLLKELETGRGKEVFEQVKRDYVTKEGKLKFKDAGNRLDVIEIATGKRFTFFSEESKQKALQEKLIGEKYTLEEQQEEAIVTLLGMMAADKLDAKKDATLISKLKELWKQISDFVKSLLRQAGIKIDELPITTTLNDLAEIMAYGNNKIILPGYKIEYSTPLGNKYDTLEEVNNEIRGLADANVEVDLSGVKIEKHTGVGIPAFIKTFERNENGVKVIYSRLNEQWKKHIEGEYEQTKITIDEANKAYSTETSLDNYVQQFIEKNKEYEQSKEIIEEWKKENNIIYDPEEVYSRGQGFYSSIGAYSNLELDLLLKNLIQHIQDNKKAGGEFTISAFTKPIGKRLKHIEGTGDKVRFVIYPRSEHIKWAAPTDVYSGSVWDAHEKVSKDKKSELLGVSFTKAPALRNIHEVSPNLADIIDNLSHVHNELGIELTTNNFRIEYDDNIDYSTKKLIDNINKILDDKYGKLVKPEIKKIESKLTVEQQKELKQLEELREAQKETATPEWVELFTKEDEKRLKYLQSLNIQGKQPTQTRKNTTSIESVKDRANLVESKYDQYNDEYQSYTINGVRYVADLYEKRYQKFEPGYSGQLITKEEFEANKPKQKEYTSQALTNLKIAALKEVARKYPRSLITSKVVSINPNMVDNSEIQYSKVGSKQDIENFANFVAYKNSDFSKIGNINQFRDYIMSKNFAAIEEFLVVNNKIDRKC